MTTLQLNQKLLGELSTIVGDEEKMRQAIRVLHIIAVGNNDISPDYTVAGRSSDHNISDNDWDKYFANKPLVDLPSDTDTESFVRKAKGRTIKQMKQWL